MKMTKKVILLIMLSLAYTVSLKAQHIVYSDFMKYVKIASWSKLNDAITSKGYTFAGSKKYKENTSDEYFYAVWCKNCEYDFDYQQYEWKTGVLRSLFDIRIYKNDNSTVWSYVFTNKAAYTAFLNTAKTNGYKFSHDGIRDKYIYSIYKRTNSQKRIEESLEFDEYSDYYTVEYWVMPITINSQIKNNQNEPSSETKVSNKSTTSTQINTSNVVTNEVEFNNLLISNTSHKNELAQLTDKDVDTNTSDNKEYIGITEHSQSVFSQLIPLPTSKEPEDIVKKEVESKIFDVVDQAPSFKGGQSSLMSWLSQNIIYPPEAEEKGIQGRVVASFIVEKDGSISNVEIVQSVDSILDCETVRLLKAMPKWLPGKQSGVAVRVKYNIPISFILQSDEEENNKKLKKKH